MENDNLTPKADQSRAGKILTLLFFLLIAEAVGVTYYRTMVLHDYIVEAKIDCDPSVEQCFVYECDPEAEECTGNPEEDTSYYKIIKKNAKRIPLCDPNDEKCKPLVCKKGEKECEIITCSEETKGEDGVCITPEEYNAAQQESESEEGEEVNSEESGDANEEGDTVD